MTVPQPFFLAVDWWALGPVMVLTGGALLLLLLEFIPPRGFTAIGSEFTIAAPSSPLAKKSPSGVQIEGSLAPS